MSTRDNTPSNSARWPFKVQPLLCLRHVLAVIRQLKGHWCNRRLLLRGIVRNPLRDDECVTPLVLRTAWLTCGRLPAVLQHADSAPRLVRLAACRVGQKRKQPHAK